MNKIAIVRSIVTVVIVVILGMYLRSGFESYRWLQLGRAERGTGNVESSITSFRRSISWVAPGLPFSNQAIIELMKITTDVTVDPKLQSLALEESKRGIQASRSFLDGILGRQIQLQEIEGKTERQIPVAEKEKAITEQFPPQVHYTFQIAAQLAFVLWVFAVFFGIWRGFDSSGKLDRKVLVRAMVFWLISFSSWLLALRFA